MNLVTWDLPCPRCGKVFDSGDGYGDTRAMIRDHIAHDHATEIVDTFLTDALEGEQS